MTESLVESPHPSVWGSALDGLPEQIHSRTPTRGYGLSLGGWIWFALQMLAIAALEEADDVVRGNLDPPDISLALQHARQVMHLEQAHGFFVEPSVQLWARHLHGLGGLLSYASLIRATDVIYAVGQTIIPLLVALWIVRRHRAHFPAVRNITLVTVLLSLVGYELYPLAPPRLVTGLIYDHHPFQFQNTMQHVIGDGKLNGVPIAYNAYSAMPSLHIAMALLVAGCVMLLGGSLLVRLLAGLYPLLMLFTVVVTANHYLLDAAGGTAAVALAALIVLAAPRVLVRIRPPGPRTRSAPTAVYPVRVVSARPEHVQRMVGSEQRLDVDRDLIA